MSPGNFQALRSRGKCWSRRLGCNDVGNSPLFHATTHRRKALFVLLVTFVPWSNEIDGPSVARWSNTDERKGGGGDRTPTEYFSRHFFGIMITCKEPIDTGLCTQKS